MYVNNLNGVYMTQFNVKNIALAAMLMCSVGDALGATTAPKVAADDSSAQNHAPEALVWVREHSKTLFAGLTTAGIAAFAVYATVCVQKIKKQLKKFELTPRNNKAMQLRAELNNWLFLRNISWVACAAAGGLTALGTAHHMTKDCLWATDTSKKGFWPNFGRRVLGHSGVQSTEQPGHSPAFSFTQEPIDQSLLGAAGAGAVGPSASTSGGGALPQGPVHPTVGPQAAGGASDSQQSQQKLSDASGDEL
jgi:hypothetical protein